MDNYTEFIQRLDAASSKLERRRQALNNSLELVNWLYQKHHTGLREWEQRRNRLDGLLAGHTGTAGSYKSLSDLQDIARNMESMFRKRTERIGERLAVVRHRYDEIDRSQRDLDRSKLKLESSRRLSADRENLRKAMTDLAGTPDASLGEASDPDLRSELNDAREAIALAEALLEVKGD
ncbi:hypothetical protein [Arthrobacter sp. H5]|uniref:hypothetical protein n=1 Tax=Arthrobacter sp. H5 TaxID=1267973 RepID=UPI000482CAE5|nr:hypothetical protein [Arthrobacter sp. H5]